MTISQATMEDLASLVILENNSFSKEEFALSKKNFIYHIKNNFLLNAKEGNELIGYILVLVKPKIPRIYSLAVSKNHRNKGIASKLLCEVISKFHTLSLEVNINNKEAINLYCKLGFKTKKVIKKYYLNGEDAFKMLINNV